MIDGVETRIIEDRESRNGQLVELTRDYRNGKVTGLAGSWLSGVNGAKFGLMMPGQPKAGQRFFQEQAPGVGMDRSEILADNEKVVTPAGVFDKCIRVVETSPVEKGLKDHK